MVSVTNTAFLGLASNVNLAQDPTIFQGSTARPLAPAQVLAQQSIRTPVGTRYMYNVLSKSIAC